MIPSPKIVINTSEEFSKLSHAPITEAVIEIRVALESAWDDHKIELALKDKLPDYPIFSSQKQFKQEFQINISPDMPAKQTFSDLGLKGFRFQSEDKYHIAQFNKDAFIFSRLRPYDNWHLFVNEAFRLWQIYSALAKPFEVLRIGLRFINRISCPIEGFELDKYLRIVPQPPFGLDVPFTAFLHHDTVMIPDYPYNVNIIKTIQPSTKPNEEDLGLIIDIDVFTTKKLPIDCDILLGHLEEMRWLKNKVFFGNITENLREALK